MAGMRNSMISLNEETPLSLKEAARILPPTRQDKRVHVSTLTRWILHGVQGVRLEAYRIGGRWVTTREALERFSAALTDNRQYRSPSSSPPCPQVGSAFRRRQDQIERELADHGV
jgi:hypothetical protein